MIRMRARFRNQGHLLEIGHGIVERLLVEGRNLAEHGKAAEQHGVAVGRGLSHPVRSRHAAGAADILDDHLLTQEFAQARRQDPRLGIVRPACRIGHHQGHRPYRPLLRMGERAE